MEWLFADMASLQKDGLFTRSGLSDTSRGKQQGFGTQDRSVSPVPWWKDALQGHTNNKSNIVAPRLQELRHVLAQVLRRPTMAQNDLAHECYYSISGPGSFLPRHMDEKHEDLKGSKGWLLPSRRSLSWLLYLSDANWTLDQNGGALRTFPPRNLAQPREPTHEGNLQIAWLHRGAVSVPVYLDSWFRRQQNSAMPHAILYTLNNKKQERQYLTQPWLNDNLPPNVLPMDFLQQMAAHDATTIEQPLLFLQPTDARDFHLIEDRQVWDAGHDPIASDTQDIAPLRGSLVIFDSVLLPHQVQAVKQGQRVALAGWFHERTQDFPQDFYDTPAGEL